MIHCDKMSFTIGNDCRLREIIDLVASGARFIMGTNLRCCLMAVGVLGAGLVGCGGSSEVDTGEVDQTVYVDTTTMQAMVGPSTDETPALNPKTGKRTLMPALYCPGCLRWHPVPSVDQINRVPDATKCRKTGATLTTDGPWPE